MQAHIKAQGLPDFLHREWLDTNRRGSYASSTLIDCPTRRYHGLLVSDAGFLDEKWVLLAKLETSVLWHGREIDLYTNKYPAGRFQPEGYAHLEQVHYKFQFHSLFRLGPLLLERSVQLLYEQDTVLVHYRLIEGDSCTLHLRPLLAYRPFHQLKGEREFHVKTFPISEGWKIEPLAYAPALHFQANQSLNFYPGPYWQKQLEYEVEQQRGFDYQEDLFCPGLIAASITPENPLVLAFGLNPLEASAILPAWQSEQARRKHLYQRFQSDSYPLGELKYEAEKFLIQRRNGQESIVAGYPWFGEWGRDTMIALPGLTLARGELDRCLGIVKSYLSEAKQGLIPNFLHNNGHDHNYQSIDAGLWLFDTIAEYREAGGSLAALRPLQPALRKLLEDLRDGHCPLARCSPTGLLAAGDRQTQLTWMDAKVRGKAVTPRHGWAVEINALWYNALAVLLELERALDLPVSRRDLELLEIIPGSFFRAFWLSDRAYLADTVDPETLQPDPALRPNQIFALSLHHPLIKDEYARSVMQKVTADLLTPYGLRTLSPRDREFCAFYQGLPAERDGAYHQGTVWPWLLYAYTKASLRAWGDTPSQRDFLHKNLQAVWTEHLQDAGIMGISEIFDAMPPHAPNGCTFQAWSVAEVIRVLSLLRAKTP